jgi:hypothetical protein
MPMLLSERLQQNSFIRTNKQVQPYTSFVTLGPFSLGYIVLVGDEEGDEWSRFFRSYEDVEDTYVIFNLPTALYVASSSSQVH